MTIQEEMELNERMVRLVWPDAARVFVYQPRLPDSPKGTILVFLTEDEDGPMKDCDWFTHSLDDCFHPEHGVVSKLKEEFGVYHIGFAEVEGTGMNNCYLNKSVLGPKYAPDHREEGRSKELTTVATGECEALALCAAADKLLRER